MRTVAVMRLALGGIGAGEGGMCWARTIPPPLSWLGAPPKLGKQMNSVNNTIKPAMTTGLHSEVSLITKWLRESVQQRMYCKKLQAK